MEREDKQKLKACVLLCLDGWVVPVDAARKCVNVHGGNIV